MSKQIALRLPDDLVDFLDEAVRDGDVTSRAALVSRALERERRRKGAERDAAILAQASDQDDDLGALANYVARLSRDYLD